MLGPAPHRARKRLRVLTLLAFALFSALPALAHAQSARASFFLQMLRQNPDARVRVSAALRLGELREADTVAPLIQAFSAERDPAVLSAILSTFASIGDSRALPTVQGALRHPNSSVSAQARRAQAALQSAARPSNQGGGGGTPRFLIGIGTVNNQSGVRSSQLAAVAQDAIQRALAQNGSVVVHNGNVATGQSRMRSSNLRGHFFNANIQSVQPRGNGVRVAVSIAVSTYPGRVYEFEASSALTITGGSSSGTQAEDDAVRRAVESAVNRAVNQLLQSGP